MDTTNIALHIITGAFSFLALALWGFYKPLPDKVNQLGDRLTRVETKLDVFIHVTGTEIAKVLHSPHTPILDAFLEKFDAGAMSDSEIHEFEKLLVAMRTQMEIPKVERTCAGLLLATLHAKYKTSTVKKS